MNLADDKVMPLKEAIATYVKEGFQLCIGGFSINRNPMGAVYEIIRQKIGNLHVLDHSNGQGVDELIGAGCVSKLEIAYGGNGRFAPTCVRFRKAVQGGTLRVEDYTNYQMSLRFLAGAMGVPFLPTRSSLGTSILDTWGFSEAYRKENDRIPDKKLVVTDNPFGTWGDAPRLVLVPAINADVAIIHAQQADRQGTVRIKGLTFTDVEKAKSAKHLIITCEQLVEPDVLRDEPDQNQIPLFCVDAVVPLPYGAYPTACYRYYDYDPVYLKAYRKKAEDDTLYEQYLEECVCGVKDHDGYLDRVGQARLDMIKADKKRGYALHLNR